MINFDLTPNNHDQQYFLAILETLQLVAERLDKLDKLQAMIEKSQNHIVEVSKKVDCNKGTKKPQVKRKPKKKVVKNDNVESTTKNTHLP